MNLATCLTRLIAVWLISALPITSLAAAEITVGNVQEIRSVNMTSEGSLDWVHLGLVDANSFNRKAAVTPRLAYSLVSSFPSAFGHVPSLRSSLSWSDGTPTASSGPYSGGVYWPALNSGYNLAAPADTATRTMTLHLGGWNSTGQLLITLSDNSVAPVTLNLSGASVYHHTITVTYSAATAGQTLNVRHTMTNSGGNIALQGATLAGPAPNNPPVLASPGNKSVTVGSLLTFAVSATDNDGPAPLVLSISASSPALPGGVFTDNGGGAGTFAWTPTLAQVGTYNVTFRAAESNGTGQQDTKTITISVSPVGTSGQLSATAPTTAPFNNNLTTEGNLDWMHFGLTTAASVNRKSGVPVRLTYTKLNADPFRFGDGPTLRPTHSWTDGSPTAANAGFSGGIYFPTLNSGYTITAPADTQTRTVKLHLGGWNSTGQIALALSDNSASPVTFNISGASVYHNMVTITYNAASANQTLTVTHTMTNSGGNIALQSATLTGAASNSPPNLANPGNRTVVAANPLNFTVTATDPDGPAPLVLDISSSSPALPASAVFTDNGSGSGSFAWTPTNAQAGTYNVTFRARENAGSGQSDTKTITITVSTNQPPVLTSPGNKTVNAGNLLTFAVNATDTDGPAPLVLDLSSSSPTLPASATFIDNGNGAGTFSWTPTVAQVGAYSVTFRARESNGSGQNDTETISITVSTTASGQLTVNVPTPAPYTNSLTSEGSLDWMHFHLASGGTPNRKAGVSAQLVYTLLSGTANQFGDGPLLRPTHTWSDGTPVASNAGFSGGTYYPGNGASYRITAPADTTERTLKVHMGGWNSTATLNVVLSDGSSAPFSTTISGASVYHREATVTYKAASAGQTVSLTLTATTGTGNIVLQSATLGGPVTPLLPFSDDFNDGNFNGWTVVNESINLGNWSVVGGELRELNMVEDASARMGTYQLGSYLYLNAGNGLTDYRFSVSTNHLVANSVLAEDVGVMFRYQNANNYYRLSLNSRHGYSRLEKRVGGTFTTLAVNARGYKPGINQAIIVETRGSNLFVWINGDPVYAVSDTSITSGTVALYAKHQTRFDNVSITDPSATPTIVLSSPLAYATRNGTSLATTALAANVPAGGSVQFLLDGANSIIDSTAPYSTTYSGVAPGNHTVEARLRNSSSTVVATDTNTIVGVTGDEIVAVGDSITNGIGDFYATDNVSTLERFIGFQGPQTTMIDTLDATRGFTPTIVFNEGMGGDDAFDAAFTRIDSIKERYPGMDRVIIGLGTNDAFTPVPSGLGCSASACNNTFKSYMETLVDKIRWTNYPTNTVPSNIEVRVASTPPVWIGTDPWNYSANVLIREYNQVIASELTGVTAGANLYSYFMPSASTTTHRPYLFSDSLHPNGLGYELIATLWHNNLEPASPLALPFVPTALTSSLSTNVPTVDLIETGDVYRLNTSDTISSMPASLVNGRWIKTNNDSGNTSANYLSFAVDRAVTVYIAYDGGSTARPSWMSTYTSTGQSVGTSDPNGPTMNLYSRTFSSGSTVTLGGNNATGAANSNTNYIAIIVEN